MRLSKEPVVLRLPRNTWDWVLDTDASDTAIAGVLLQKDEQGAHHVVAYSIKSLTTTEKKWGKGGVCDRLEHRALCRIPPTLDRFLTRVSHRMPIRSGIIATNRREHPAEKVIFWPEKYFII